MYITLLKLVAHVEQMKQSAKTTRETVVFSK